MSDTTITFLVLAATVGVFIWDRIPVAIVAIGVALTLWATGVLGYEQSLQGFGDPTVIFIASLFVVSEGLDASGVTAWAGQELIARAGESRTRLLVFMLLLVAFLTALISRERLGRRARARGRGARRQARALTVTAADAAGVRCPRRLAARADRHARQRHRLRTPPTRPASGRSASSSSRSSAIPLLVGTIAIIVLFGERLLPHRKRARDPRDFSNHARTLVEQYTLSEAPDTLLTRSSGVAEVMIPPRSGLIGETVFPGMITESGDLVVLAVQRKGEDLSGETVLARR